MKTINYYIEFIKGWVIKFWINIMMNTSLQTKDWLLCLKRLILLSRSLVIYLGKYLDTDKHM